MNYNGRQKCKKNQYKIDENYIKFKKGVGIMNLELLGTVIANSY